MNLTLPKLITQIKERITTDLLLHISTEHKKYKKSTLNFLKISAFSIGIGIISSIFLNTPNLPKFFDFFAFMLTFLGIIGGAAMIIVSSAMFITLNNKYNKIFNINLKNNEELLAKLIELNTEESKQEFEEFFKLSKFSYTLKNEEIQTLMNLVLNKEQITYLKNTIIHKEVITMNDLEELSKLSTTAKLNEFLEKNHIKNSTVGKILMQDNNETEVEYDKYI